MAGGSQPVEARRDCKPGSGGRRLGRWFIEAFKKSIMHLRGFSPCGAGRHWQEEEEEEDGEELLENRGCHGPWDAAIKFLGCLTLEQRSQLTRLVTQPCLVADIEIPRQGRIAAVYMEEADRMQPTVETDRPVSMVWSMGMRERQVSRSPD